jgi:putative two-component system response regulator
LWYAFSLVPLEKGEGVFMAEKQTPTILVVDDLPENTQVLESFLRPLGYHVESANNGASALEMIHDTPPDVILLDVVMPGMDGFEVCSRLKASPATRHIPVIMITGLNDRKANVRALELGADDFLIKPFDRPLLQVRIASCLKTKGLQDEIIGYQEELEERIHERTRQLEITQQITVFSLARLAESRDNDTGDHIDRMRSYAFELAQVLRNHPDFSEIVDDHFVREIYQSCPLHDIGKVGIPDCILLKPGKLTDLEFEIMKTHSSLGGDTLRAPDEQSGVASFLTMGRDIAYHHHEKWDGSGYPFGLAGDDIPVSARIVALADVYDALSTKRPYKEPFSHEKCKAIVLEGHGKHFDPRVADAFLECEDHFVKIRAEFQSTGRLSPTQEFIERVRTAEESDA